MLQYNIHLCDRYRFYSNKSKYIRTNDGILTWWCPHMNKGFPNPIVLHQVWSVVSFGLRPGVLHSTWDLGWCDIFNNSGVILSGTCICWPRVLRRRWTTSTRRLDSGEMTPSPPLCLATPSNSSWGRCHLAMVSCLILFFIKKPTPPIFVVVIVSL